MAIEFVVGNTSANDASPIDIAVNPASTSHIAIQTWQRDGAGLPTFSTSTFDSNTYTQETATDTTVGRSHTMFRWAATIATGSKTGSVVWTGGGLRNSNLGVYRSTTGDPISVVAAAVLGDSAGATNITGSITTVSGDMVVLVSSKNGATEPVGNDSETKRLSISSSGWFELYDKLATTTSTSIDIGDGVSSQAFSVSYLVLREGGGGGGIEALRRRREGY